MSFTRSLSFSYDYVAVTALADVVDRLSMTHGGCAVQINVMSHENTTIVLNAVLTDVSVEDAMDAQQGFDEWWIDNRLPGVICDFTWRTDVV